jgi:hypothetical protein
MTVSRPCYCSREDVQRALDAHDTAASNARIDRAIQSAATAISGTEPGAGRLKRSFFPEDATRFFDWPNYDYAYPWRIWLSQHDLIVPTSLVTGGVTIPLDQVFAEPVNSGPPYTYLELDRSTSAAFGGNAATPQHSVMVTGTWGYNAEMDAAGTLAAAVATTTAATVTVTDGSLMGVGDLLILNPGRAAAPYPSAAGYAGALGAYTGERVLVTDRAAVATGQVQSDSGCSSVSAADNSLLVADGTQVHVYEVLQLDSEQMLVENVTGNVATVKRAWNGTVLAEHAAAAVYAFRLLSVLRGQLGTAAATYSQGAAVSRHRPPPLVRDLALALAENQAEQETSGYARTVGEGDNARPASGSALWWAWQQAIEAHGRKARIRAV